MNLIHNLAEHDMGSCSIRAGAPADHRLVVLQDIMGDGKVMTIGARFFEGRWYAAETGDIHDSLSDRAIWIESPYSVESCWPSEENKPKKELVSLRPPAKRVGYPGAGEKPFRIPS